MEGHVAESSIPEIHDLLEMIHSLSDALESHHEWIWNIQRAIVCGESTAHSCHFDHWLQIAGALGFLGGTREFAPVMSAHAAVHAFAFDLLNHANGGGKPTTGMYDDFLRARKAFKVTASELERSLWSETCLIDSLTGLRNRHGMMMELREEQQRASREGCSCVIAMMDIDHFKLINDSHGHATGDAVLSAVTHLTARRLRPYDRIYRYGGEEFLICLPDTDVPQAQGIIERLREEIASRPVQFGDSDVLVTVSFGLSAVEASSPVDESIRRADRALFAAKQNGRNRVIAAER
jgi:diguanylate cyclase (GGDEF)-like protein